MRQLRLTTPILLFQFCYKIPNRAVHLRRLCQLLTQDAAAVGSVGMNEAAIDRHVLALHQTHTATLIHDALKQLLEEAGLLETSVPVLRESGVVGNLLIEAQPREPAPSEVNPQLLDQL